MTNKLISNYYGTDADTKKWMDQADGYTREISRLRAEGKSTIGAGDRLEIMDAICHWDNAYDALDRQAFLDIMTDDVYCFGNAWGEVKGKAAMGEWFDGFTKTFSGKRHTISNFTVLGNDQQATALSYLAVVERVESTNVIATALYFDKFVKQDSKWLIKERYQILDPGMFTTADGRKLYAEYMKNSQG